MQNKQMGHLSPLQGHADTLSAPGSILVNGPKDLYIPFTLSLSLNFPDPTHEPFPLTSLLSLPSQVRVRKGKLVFDLFLVPLPIMAS